ncbi:exopolysaccharide biosynthesis polyprenyl glycosylphosphotransferase [Mucilaginibacter sp. HMF5004]|nr:exopolysaccharide biosynthesis polyprenyl glycosylphosphotransferase [Mucilaginibacter rivuli]
MQLILIYIYRDYVIAKPDFYIVSYIYQIMVWLICSYLTGVYVNNDFTDFSRNFKRSGSAFLIFLSLVLLFNFFLPYYNRQFVIFSAVGFITYLFLSRALIVGINFFMYQDDNAKKKIIIIGYNELSDTIVHHFSQLNKTVLIKGYFDYKENAKHIPNLPFLGKVEECFAYCVANEVSEIYCTLSPEKDPEIYKLSENAERNFIRFKFVPDLRLFVNREIKLDYIQDIPVLSLRSEPLESSAGRLKKRVFDIVFSGLVCIFLLSWLVPIIALLIKLDSRGPVFFVQQRSGKNNIPFPCIKFRSLKVNKESDTLQVTRNDSRFTKLGSFLRKSSLDELPQFFNVIMGHMSVVGSRPHMLKHTDEYSKIYDEYMIRHFLKPGITGWAQIHGFRGEIKVDEQLRKRVEHDVWYIENWTLGLDINIIVLTFWLTVKGDDNAF